MALWFILPASATGVPQFVTKSSSRRIVRERLGPRSKNGVARLDKYGTAFAIWNIMNDSIGHGLSNSFRGSRKMVGGDLRLLLANTAENLRTAAREKVAREAHRVATGASLTLRFAPWVVLGFAVHGLVAKSRSAR